MSSTRCSRVWTVAASMGSVEALKDQGFCRWNYAMRSLHNSAKNCSFMRSFSQDNRKLTVSPHDHEDEESSSANLLGFNDRIKGSEESLRKVMYLSCWGPN